jgi:hypothetical protein
MEDSEEREALADAYRRRLAELSRSRAEVEATRCEMHAVMFPTRGKPPAAPAIILEQDGTVPNLSGEVKV